MDAYSLSVPDWFVPTPCRPPQALLPRSSHLLPTYPTQLRSSVPLCPQVGHDPSTPDAFAPGTCFGFQASYDIDYSDGLWACAPPHTRRPPRFSTLRSYCLPSARAVREARPQG